MALTIFVVGFAMASLGATPFSDDLCSLDGYPEGTSVESQLSMWPPGATECTYEPRTGETTRSTVAPWREWLSASFFALGCGLAVSAIGGSGRRLQRAALSAALVMFAIAIAFGLP